MRISNALVGIILTFTSWNVRASKNGMSGTDAIAAAAAARESVQREFRLLMSSNNNNSNNYEYKRNYITIIERDNFLSTDPDGKSAGDRIFQVTQDMTIPTSIGTAIIQNGKIYDPADIVIVNKPNGIEAGDLFEAFGEIAPLLLIGQRYAGDRQPKTPIPVGDSAYFFHGECVATSALPFAGKFPGGLERRDRRELNEVIQDFSFLEGAFVITSHTCLLNLCLGGGGFDCIAIYAGTSFVFDFGQQLNLVASIPEVPDCNCNWGGGGNMQVEYTRLACSAAFSASGNCVDEGTNPLNAWYSITSCDDSTVELFSGKVKQGDIIDIAVTAVTLIPACLNATIMEFTGQVTQIFTIESPCAGGDEVILGNDYGALRAIGYNCDASNVQDLVRTTPTLPPPYPATIIGGTGSFEGIEGTVQIATIAGTAGAFFDVAQGPFGGLQRFGSIVQSISVTSNMPLPTAP
ncbi:hypothetical protein FRACYDRAFT_241428 [Fragilariopsis cylindrus CCMP1102]|uniref:Uncharacterized protein n=1 Tax=Fragilariopsis cylindrus CCMP1102 TaxID=635003 RepID=A0A1E7F9L9_9STRA|nr:hypothetical protein FRACYDRAFT_241428 [Fragilariopsis cylindrus CCMP1102]|eukprot:OEU14871.1 hypothetical protein FRACYDRAFT_241428 [Fragilariopsis cylindrus CCMP1102]